MILKPGDEVAIIAPAARCADSEAGFIERAAEVLKDWGLSVTLRIARTNHFYLAGNDAVRARHLQEALAEPATRAIFAARGGYGSMRLFAELRRDLVHADKILVGFSDITALHLAAARLWPGIHLLHGPNLATRQFLDPGLAAETNRASLYRALFDPLYAIDSAVEFLRPGRASGPLRGGCLSLMAAMLGSAFAPTTEGAILFLEDVDEAPYRIDRLLVQLRNAGLFADVAGVVFGVMPGCSDDAHDLRDIVLDVLAGTTFPLAWGLPAGHGERNITLPLGNLATLDSTTGRFRLTPRLSPLPLAGSHRTSAMGSRAGLPTTGSHRAVRDGVPGLRVGDPERGLFSSPLSLWERGRG